MEEKTGIGKPDKQVNSRLAEARVETQWKPGQSGNPAGRPKNELSITNLMRLKLDDVPTEIMGQPYTGEKMWRELIAEAALGGAALGQSAYTKEILDRLEGRVTDKLDATLKVQSPIYLIEDYEATLCLNRGYSEDEESNADQGQSQGQRAGQGENATVQGTA